MNKPIRALAITFGLLFLSLLLGINHLQVVQATDLNARPDNRRVIDEEFSRERGSILVAGEPIAESVPVDTQWAFQRRYPQGKLYADITGYYSYIYGREGIEQTYNSVLSGNDDRLFVNRLVDLVSNKKPQGGSVELTINPQAQAAAAASLADLGNKRMGAVVAIEPATGSILAMASQPTYDPNELASHDLKSVQAAWARLNADASKPMLNRSTRSALPPGSTFKLITAATAIEDMGLGRKSMVKAGRELTFPGIDYTLTNSGGGSCGGNRITFEKSLAVSCNVSYGWLGLEVGQEKLADKATAFGFESKPLTDLGSYASHFTAKDKELEDPQLAQSAIGQFEVRATPIQMAMVAAGIANDGIVMKPQLVRTLRAPNTQIIEQIVPQELAEAMTPADADELTAMMVTTVDSGTGRPAKIRGVKVAGKTGTAQSAPDRPAYAWFVSFAPANDPQVAVAVLVESTKDTGDIAGGRLGGPIARAVMEAALR
ncbi:MAG: penicillin-binding protein 2 [Aeromicrobium sp.]|nr:MAG: penicillin-binding protein 2 [Aeromicrobium sp.]